MAPKRKIDQIDDKNDQFQWTYALTNALIDAFVHQHNMGNRVNGTFTTKAYDNILHELKMKFPEAKLDKDRIRNRIKYMKKRFALVWDLFQGGFSGFGWNPVTSMFEADDEVWAELIKANPAANEWRCKPFLNYDKLSTLYGCDRATGEFSETNADAHKNTTTGFLDNIDFINNLASFNEAILEPCNFSGINNKSDENTDGDSVCGDKDGSPPLDGGGSSVKENISRKRAKGKSKVVDDDFKTIASAIRDVANVMKETNDIMRGTRPHISQAETFALLTEMNIEDEYFDTCYLYLIEKPDKLNALLVYPVERRKNFLMKMVFG